MSACLPVYGSALLATSYRKLWNSLKLEVFQPTDQETESVALFTLKALISTLYSNVGDLSSDDGLIAAICAECLDILKSPDTSQAKPAIKILSSSLSTIGECLLQFVCDPTMSSSSPGFSLCCRTDGAPSSQHFRQS